MTISLAFSTFSIIALILISILSLGVGFSAAKYFEQDNFIAVITGLLSAIFIGVIFSYVASYGPEYHKSYNIVQKDKASSYVNTTPNATSSSDTASLTFIKSSDGTQTQISYLPKSTKIYYKHAKKASIKLDGNYDPNSGFLYKSFIGKITIYTPDSK